MRIAETLSVDGALDEAIYESVLAMDGFVQQEPVEGAPASEQTQVWVLFNDDTLYVSARLWDS